ncbi:MAG: DUF5615 family PIN-like protein [Bacteroidales bacterium]
MWNQIPNNPKNCSRPRLLPIEYIQKKTNSKEKFVLSHETSIRSNISYRITHLIAEIFSESKQVRELKLENSTESQIWEYAKINYFCIVTFDSDFYDLSLVKGSPPKIIWLRMGNSPTKSLEKIIRDNEILIKEFLENSEYKEISCLELD